MEHMVSDRRIRRRKPIPDNHGKAPTETENRNDHKQLTSRPQIVPKAQTQSILLRQIVKSLQLKNASDGEGEISHDEPANHKIDSLREKAVGPMLPTLQERNRRRTPYLRIMRSVRPSQARSDTEADKQTGKRSGGIHHENIQ